MKKRKLKHYRSKSGRFISKKRYYALLKRRKRYVQIKTRRILRKKLTKRKKTRQVRLRPRIRRRAYRLRKRLRPRRRARVRARPSRAVARPPQRRLPVARLQWISAEKYRQALVKKWNIDLYRSDPLSSKFSYFFTSPKFFNWTRRYPPASRLYVVFSGWYVVFNEEDEEYYLWVRNYSLKRKITFADYARLVKKDKRLQGLTLQQLEMRLPVHVRAAPGISWNDVLKRKAGLVRSQIDSIEDDPNPTSISPGGYYQVKAFVGWTAYPAAGDKR